MVITPTNDEFLGDLPYGSGSEDPIGLRPDEQFFPEVEDCKLFCTKFINRLIRVIFTRGKILKSLTYPRVQFYTGHVRVYRLVLALSKGDDFPPDR
jgi:hypothetical protein